MTTLNINGRRVTVDDSFKSLSPEQQNATVEEISQGLGGQQQPVPSAETAPAPPQDESAAPEVDQDQPQQTLSGAANTWLENAISGIPVIGPAIQKGSDYLGTEAIGLLTGQDPAQMRAGLNERREQRNEQYPASALSGNLAGAIGSTGALGATGAGARALGITGESLLGRAGASAASNAAISGADNVARGGSPADTINSSVIGGGIGAAIPLAGAGIRSGLGAISERIAPTINAVRAPTQEAERRLGVAVARDSASNPGNLLNATDEAVAKATGVPLINADRGGETTRALARSVANQSPEARAIIEKTASDRFGAQSQRATDFIRMLTGGATDDIGYQQALKDAARYVNKPRYEKAFNSPNAQQVFTPELQDLMQSPAMQRAASMATGRSANRGAVEGFKAVKNPFHQAADGSFKLRQSADGKLISPTLQFWDQVKRNLDSTIGRAQRAGDNTLFGDLSALKSKLTSTLDAAVPEYKAARQGAASYFGAEDALDAGKKFANSPRQLPEANRVFEKFSPPEKAAFRTGFASEMIDRIKASPDRSNVINQVFKSQAAREQMQLVFGPAKTRQIEAYVRVEDLADKLRGALGNSTTARQLVELGLGATGGYAYGGDLQSMAAGAMLTRGAGALSSAVSGRANAKVMEKIAEMLTSDNPKAVQNAIKQASKSDAFMNAIKDLSGLIAAPARGAAMVTAQ